MTSVEPPHGIFPKDGSKELHKPGSLGKILFLFLCDGRNDMFLQ